ncbi:MAG: 30S ribosomal protein S20 [Holosporales bacterium]|jgi:small subunit ribosomal protein S20|nr:30S ribosomal protein S20 [Holosporales bacterium]
MPSHKSAEKAVRQAAKRTQVNKARISRIRTFVKKVETAVSLFGKDPAITSEAIQSSIVVAEKELMRGVAHGVLHKNAASRKVSRLTLKARKATAVVVAE